MPNIQQFDKTDKLTIRCPSDFKREVLKAAIDRSQSTEEMCVRLIAESLGLRLQPSSKSAQK